MKVPRRVPEGGAIMNTDDVSAEEYSTAQRKAMGGEYRRFVQHVLTEMKPPQGARVLEIGPGPGWITIWLAQARPDLQIDGLEPSSDMRRVATQNAQEAGVADRVSFLAGYVEQMVDQEDASYDLVISNGSLHHWEDPVQGLREIARVLKSTGRIYIQDGRRDIGLGAKFIVNCPGRILAGKEWKYWKSSINAGYTPVELRAMLSEVPKPSWDVQSNFMELWIQSVP